MTNIPKRFLNINIGVMGHVDSGKTSLSKVLSDIPSTAAFDKHPQSQERGITLDMGFSSFSVDLPEHIKINDTERLQITLVDCPGHASLIKTVIGASKIIDLIIIVIDIVHGIQVQTGECLILAEILKKDVIIVVNKIDQLITDKLDQLIKKEVDKIRNVISKLNINILKIVPVCATATDTSSKYHPCILKELIVKSITLPIRSNQGSLLFAVDHCFNIKGHGTIMTGTVIQGSLKIGDSIKIIDYMESRDVKSIQVFKQPVTSISQGDRAGICLSKFSSQLMERGLITGSHSKVENILAALIKPKIIKYYKGDIKSGSKLDISIDFSIVSCTLVLFEQDKSNEEEYIYLKHMNNESPNQDNVYGLLKFDKPFYYVGACPIIAIHLPCQAKQNSCRLQFRASVVRTFTSVNQKEVNNIKVFKWKTKNGIVDKIFNAEQLIVKNMFNHNSNISIFIGRTVVLTTGDEGVITGKFGEKGRIKISFSPDNISKKLGEYFDKNTSHSAEEISVELKYKKYRKLI